jgi:hypothetical protein
MKDFQIAVTVAAPGTGKTRLVDDALRMPLDAKPANEAKHFDHFLRLAVTFNSNYSGTYAHPFTARMLLVFFCGTVHADASIVLDRIDTKLVQLFRTSLPKIRRAEGARRAGGAVFRAARRASWAELCC